MDVASVYPRVAKIICDVLAVDESKIAMNQRLLADLGAESIDLLDLIFQLEREFKIKVPLRQIEKEARGTLSDAEFEQNGTVTAKGIEALKEHLVDVPHEFFKQNLKVNEIPTLFTVGTFCQIVVNAVLKQSQTVPA